MQIRTLFLYAAMLPAAAPFCAAATATRDDLTRALATNKAYRSAAGMLPGTPHWIDGSSVVWTSLSDGKRHDYVLLDAATGHRSSLDLARVLAALDDDAKQGADAATLSLEELSFDKAAAGFSFRRAHARWHCSLPGYVCEAQERDLPAQDDDRAPGFEGNSRSRLAVSPDGRWEASVQDFNVFLHAKGSAAPPLRLSSDGREGDYYQISSLQWSPDSRHLLALRVQEGMRRQVHYVQSSPEDQLQPLASSRFYAKPGDLLDRTQPVLFDADTAARREIATSAFPNPYELSQFSWRADSSAFTFLDNERGHQRLSVLAVDAQTGEVTHVVDERSSTFVEYTDLDPEPEGTGKFFRHDIHDGREMLWLSERDGWAHLYLFDGRTGQLKNQVTHGPWVVRGVEHIDEARRQIFFDASGVDPKLDPYFTQLYRINFDGTGMVRLSGGDLTANHTSSFSSDGAFFVDEWSRVDLAPVIKVRRTQDQGEVATLFAGDLAPLRAAGWSPPEVFTAKGRDGVTEIWGLIYKPLHFDPKRKYPVVEDIYAGPQGSFVPKTFTTRAQPLTQLGFVVVQIDGMGTNNRSKAFHDVAWKNLKDAGFADRILWHQAAAARFPWYDATRVGIFGTSAGGQSALGALLFHPEFYKAAVANSGCHDNRMDKIWWNEQWMGWPIGKQYEDSSNVVNAWRLQGRLLLVMGEMDSNVDPSSTLQVANALIHADKDFELLDVPNGGHGAGGEYGQRRLMEFFLRSLTSDIPANWNSTDAASARAAAASGR